MAKLVETCWHLSILGPTQQLHLSIHSMIKGCDSLYGEVLPWRHVYIRHFQVQPNNFIYLLKTEGFNSLFGKVLPWTLLYFFICFNCVHVPCELSERVSFNHDRYSFRQQADMIFTYDSTNVNGYMETRGGHIKHLLWVCVLNIFHYADNVKYTLSLLIWITRKQRILKYLFIWIFFLFFLLSFVRDLFSKVVKILLYPLVFLYESSSNKILHLKSQGNLNEIYFDQHLYSNIIKNWLKLKNKFTCRMHYACVRTQSLSSQATDSYFWSCITL